MKKSEMIKTFAKLEGIELTRHKNAYLCKSNNGNVTINGVQFSIYDPILDFALNCKARDKYKVGIDYDCLTCSIYEGDDIIPTANADITDTINYAVIECILKSKGLWV